MESNATDEGGNGFLFGPMAWGIGVVALTIGVSNLGGIPGAMLRLLVAVYALLVAFHAGVYRDNPLVAAGFILIAVFWEPLLGWESKLFLFVLGLLSPFAILGMSWAERVRHGDGRETVL